MNVDLTLVPDWVRDSVVRCPDCHVRTTDDTARVCGWHENLTAASRVVDNMARGTQ